MGKSVGFPKNPVKQRISEFQKFRLTPDPNHFYIPHCPVPQRGVAQRHQRGAGCGGRVGAFDEWRWCVRPSRVVLTPRCWRQVCDRKRRRRCQTSLVTGEITKYAVKPLRGECRVISGVTVVTTLGAFFLSARGCGCIVRPAFPAPSAISEREIQL